MVFSRFWIISEVTSCEMCAITAALEIFVVYFSDIIEQEGTRPGVAKAILHLCATKVLLDRT